MTNISMQIFDVLEKLSDERKDVIHRLALDMLTAQETEDFDNFLTEEIDEIHNARRRIVNGECLSFSSPEEFILRFGV